MNETPQQTWRQRQRESGKVPLYVWVSQEVIDRIDTLIPPRGNRADVVEAAFVKAGKKEAKP